ncbi:shikimate dehydrogenase family protein [Pedobacter sp.]|uniref:shikimate dehydrogenase family protein n=1 Tax=Pedobacter sp. TaxID=1411316 RepID=UPI003D7F538E
MVKTFGLIGYPLSHSFSKKFFTEKFDKEGIADCQYELFPLTDISMLTQLLTNKGLTGLNVTIPYKVAVIPFLNEMDDAARHIGAVNCISINHDKNTPYLKGYNTDAYGFEESLKPLLSQYHRQALIFGNGGAAKAVKYVLDKLGIPYLTVVRSAAEGCITYEEVTADLLQEYQVLINTTPLGMSPSLDTCPAIPYEALTDRHLAYDLVYNPAETLFLRMAKDRCAKTKNGLEMLELQAERSWTIWNS